jgi:hypothetical protein
MSSKLERDIDEVLAKIEKFPPRRPLGSRLRRGVSGFFGSIGDAIASIPRPGVSIGQVLLLGLALIVIAYVFGDSLFGGDIVRLMIIGGIVLFIGAFIFSLRRQSSARTPEKRWRGEVMDLDRDEGSWWKRWRSRR